MRGSMALEKERAESEEGKSMDETLSEAGEEMEVGNTPEQDSAETDFTAQELLQYLSGDDWANTATPPLGSPRKGLKFPLTSETSKMGMKLLSAEESKRNAFEGNKWIFLITLHEKTWRELLSEFEQRVMSETTLEDFKEELWKFGEPVLMGTGLDEKARKELLSMMNKLRETEQKTKDDACKTSSLPNKKTDDKMIKVERDDKSKTSKMIKDISILKAREGGGKNWKGRTGIKQSNQ